MKSMLTAAALLGVATACTPPSCTACPPRVRKAYSTLSCEERRLYQNAVKTLKQTRPAEYNRFVDTHVTENSFAHAGSQFYPWHRYYILGFENALRSLRGDYSCITIPYWDTESDSTDQWNSRPLRSTLWGRTVDGVTNCLQTGIPKEVGAGGFWTLSDGVSCVKRGYNPAFSFPGPMDVKLSLQLSPNYATMLSATAGIHTGPHNYLGYTFKGSSSPEEPLFWMHHANVDRVWALWQDYWGHDPTTPVSTMEYDQPLTTVMPFGASSAPGGPLPYYDPTITVQDVMYISDMPNGESYTYADDGVAALMTATWRWIIPRAATTPYIDDCNSLPPYIEYEAFVELLTVFYNGQLKGGATERNALKATAYYECSLLGNRPRADEEWIAMYGKGKPPIIYESCGAVKYIEMLEDNEAPRVR